MPVSVRKKLNTIGRNFDRDGKKDRRSIHFVKWDKVVTEKKGAVLALEIYR